MKPAALALPLLTSCAPTSSTACYSLPDDFMSDEDWWKGMPPSLDYPKNVIKVRKSGDVTWNDASLDTQHGWASVLDMYLEIVPQMEPPPIIFLDWEDGAPCASIDRVRQLMRKRLGCDGSRKCVQGRPNKNTE